MGNCPKCGASLTAVNREKLVTIGCRLSPELKDKFIALCKTKGYRNTSEGLLKLIEEACQQ